MIKDLFQLHQSILIKLIEEKSFILRGSLLIHFFRADLMKKNFSFLFEKL